jgi:hypothetical protein
LLRGLPYPSSLRFWPPKFTVRSEEISVTIAPE